MRDEVPDDWDEDDWWWMEEWWVPTDGEMPDYYEVGL